MVLVVRAGRLVVRSWQRLVVIVVVTAAACSLLFINRCKLAPHSYSGPVYSGLSGPAALSARALVESPHRARSLTLNFGHPPLDTAHSVRRQASRSTFHLHSGTEGPGIAPEGPGIAPEGSRIAPEGSRIAPEGPAIASEGPAIDPEGPAIAPEGPRIAPKHPGIVPEVTHPPREIFRSPRDSGNPYREAREGFRGRGPNFPSVTSRDSLYNQPPPPLPGRSSLGHAPHSALFEDEEQRAAYTRHLLQQIALLEQEVASLHAAAALAGVASDKPGQHAETLGGRREPLGAPHTPAAGAQQTAPQSHHGSSHFAPPPPSAGGNASSSHASTASHASSAASESACSATLQQQILQSEVVRGLPLNNEYEVVPFSHFSWSRVYPSELGLGKRVVEKPIGYRRKDVLAALTAALDHLNAYQNHGYRYSMDDFIEGSFRTIPTAGTQYELVFRDGSRPNTFNSNDNNSNNINNNNVNTNNNNTNSVSSSALPNHSDSKNSDGTNSHSPSPSDQQQAEVNSRQRRSDAIDVRVRKGISGAQTKSIDRGDNIQKPSDSIYNNNNDNDDNPSSYNFHNTNSKKDGFHDPKVVGPNIVTSDVRNSSVVDASRRDDNDDTGQKKMAPEASGTKNGTSSGKHARQGNGGGASLKVVTLMRPFAPITVVRSKTNTARQLINIILPLSGRLQTFQRFMTKLTTVILPHDRRIFLTVVYFGDAGLQRARNIITKASREANFRMVKLLTLNETFSRGKALQVGAQHWSGGDVLLFMCDVDVVFSTRFLDRCRLHATPGRSVYYPVIFSLYNPGLVYPLQGKPIPEELDQLVISRDTGFWRDFGYGMTCQYRSDFLSVNGFDQEIVGWGGEDVLLYRKYVRSSLAVIRSTDPGIFHLWHPKLCSSGLPGDQYRACLSSRALSEASHAHLGLVAFKKDLEKHPVGSQILPGISAAEKNLNTAGSYQVMGEI